MVGRKVTREIADFIYNRDKGLTLTKVSEIVKEKFGVKISYSTASLYSSHTFEDYIKKRKKYGETYYQRPDIIKRQRKYGGSSGHFIETIIDTLIDDGRFTVSEEEVKTILLLKTGFNVKTKTIRKKANSLEKELGIGPLEYRDGVYIIRPESSYFSGL